MAFNKALVFSIAIALSMVLSSIKLITYMGYDFRPAFFILLFFYLFYARYSLATLEYFLFSLLYVVLIYAYNVNQSDDLEFFKSFALYSFSLFFFILTLNVDKDIKKLINYKIILWFTTASLISFEFIQIFEQYFYDSHTSWFWLDDFSISTATDVGRFEAVNPKGYMRPVSFLYEPGFLGEMLFILIVINDKKLKSKKLEVFLLIGLMFTLSALILMLCFFYYVFKLIITSSNRYVRYFFVAMLIVALFHLEKIYIISRIDEIFTEGTSGYIRFTEPLKETMLVVAGNVFGIPLGQSDLVFNNSIFLILIYFGIFTPYIFVLLYLQLRKGLVSGFSLFQYTFVFISILLVNGALFTPESALLLGFLNYSFIEEKPNA